MTTAQAAGALGVSRRRVQALVDAGLLHGIQPGSRLRLFDASDIELLKRTMYRSPGRPLSQERTWRIIEHLELPPDHAQLDTLRRRLRTRAAHHYRWEHPDWIARVRGTLKVAFPLAIGGSDAAAHHGVPVGGPSSPLHAYTTAHGLPLLPTRPTPAGEANLIVHVVHQDIVERFGRYLPLAVAWLDMADDGERGADMVLDALR